MLYQNFQNVSLSALGFGGMRLPVGADDAVAEEVGVARGVLTVVAAVGPVGPAVGIGLQHALVDPV